MFLTLCLALTLFALPQDGTFRASSSAGTRYAPALAFDGDRKTRWSADFEVRSGWLEWTLPDEKMFDTVLLVGEGPELKGMPGKLQIEYMKEDRWIRALQQNNGTGPEVTLSFEPAASRSWRIVIETVVNDRWSPTIAEIRFSLSTEGDEEKTVEEKKARPEVTASSVRSDRFAPSSAVDGNLDTKWQASQGAVSGWIRLDFPEQREFNFLAVDVEGESGYGVPRDFRLEVRKGKSWRKVLEVSDHDRHYARKGFRSAKGKSWRLAVDSVVNKRYSLSISELRLTLEKDPEKAAGLRPPPAATPTTALIKKAIADGREYLLQKQGEEGNWETAFTEKYPEGVAALGALTLMKTGMKATSPPVIKALEIVRRGQNRSIYGTALAMMALRESGESEELPAIEEGARFLINSQKGTGLWGYPDGRPDHSNAQYALLGLHAAAESAVEVPDEVWFKAGKAFLRSQIKDGGWNYVPAGKRAAEPATGSMTAAGIASLLLCRNHISSRSKLPQEEVNRAVEGGFEWLADRFTVRLNPGSQEGLGHYYYLYGIERVGQFARKTRIGRHGWYGEGAAHLCRFQRRDGGWQGDMVDTCFALLFLTQASRPLSGN